MSKKAATVLALASFLVGPGIAEVSGQGQYAKYLSVADVQKVAGIAGVKMAPKTEEADGDLNFAREDGKVILSASFYPASAFAGARSSKSGFKSMLKGVGEEAFVGPVEGPTLYILAFRKGNHTVVINTELEDKGTPRLSLDQLTAIARLIASRM